MQEFNKEAGEFYFRFMICKRMFRECTNQGGAVKVIYTNHRLIPDDISFQFHLLVLQQPWRILMRF